MKDESRLEGVVKEIKDEIKDLKKMLASGRGETKNETTLEDAVKEIKDKIADMKQLLTACVCEYFVCLFFRRNCFNKKC